MLRSKVAPALLLIAAALTACKDESADARAWSAAVDEPAIDAFHADFLAAAAQSDWGVVDRSSDTDNGIDLVAVKECLTASATGSIDSRTVRLSFRDKCRDDRALTRIPEDFSDLVSKYHLKG